MAGSPAYWERKGYEDKLFLQTTAYIGAFFGIQRHNNPDLSIKVTNWNFRPSAGCPVR
jgi:hypothetical protein